MGIGIISPAEFVEMEKNFRELNSKLSEDELKELAERNLAELERLIATNETRENLLIYAQARNYLSLSLGRGQIEYPDIPDTPENAVATPLDPLAGKHVAVYVFQDLLRTAIKQTLGLFDNLNLKIYGEMRELIDAMLEGQISGIIGIHADGKNRGDIESHVRHDLKNRQGWGYEKAQAIILPPCDNFFPPHPLGEIISVIAMMQDGKYHAKPDEEFDFAADKSTLLPLMITPKRELNVLVVDDTAREISCMLELLRIWPKLTVCSFFQDIENAWIEGPLLPDGSPRHELLGADIILLDECMGEKHPSGTQLHKAINRLGCVDMIASTTSGDRPGWSQHHFSGKAKVGVTKEVTVEFIMFMNRLIQQLNG